MAQNGGARPGAGRKRKHDKYGTAIQKAEKKIVDRLPQLLDNLMALADGIFVEEFTPDGKRVVYQRAPDFKSNEYLINRIMGKPTERQEVSGADGAPLAVEFVNDWRNADNQDD
jgi:hypothetical protein